MRKLLIAVAVAGLAGTVNAQSAFEGAYGQIGIGYQSSKAKTVESINFNNSTGFASTVGAGYNFQVSKEFLLGLGAEYSFLPSSSANYTYDGGSGTYKNKNTYNIFLSPGFALSKDSLAYAKVGYTGTTYSFTEGSTDNFNLTGYSLGLGYKQIIDGGLYGFAEGNYMSYNQKTVGTEQVRLSGNSMNLLVGIGYKF